MAPKRKRLRWFQAGINTPPFTEEGKLAAGTLLRLLQEGEVLGMPQARAMPSIGRRCGELRIRDAEHNWRIIYRVDDDAVLVVDAFAKKTQQTPSEIVQRCQKRLALYDAAKAAAEKGRNS